MSQPKPVIHGRDHFHGGPDPAQVAWEDVGDSGSGGGAPVYHWLRCTNPVYPLGSAILYGGRAYRLMFWDFSAGTTQSGDLGISGDGTYANRIILPGLCMIQASVLCTFPPQAEKREAGLAHTFSGGTPPHPFVAGNDPVPSRFDMATGGSSGSYTPTPRQISFFGQLVAGSPLVWGPRFIEDDITESRTSSTLSTDHVLEVAMLRLDV